MSSSWSHALHKIAEAAGAVKEAAKLEGGKEEALSSPQGLLKVVEALSGKVGGAAASEASAREQKQIKMMEQYHSALQTKLDKITRQLDALTESQAKTNKVLQSLVKMSKEGAADVLLPNGKLKQQQNKEEDTSQAEAVAEKDKRDPRFCWARNLLLVGDGHWQSLKMVADDVGVQVAKLEQEWDLRIMSRPGEALNRLYDTNRGKLLFALPRGIEKIAISVGTKDLQDSDLMTLKDASLPEVRKANEPKLRKKAECLVGMIRYLDENLRGPFKVVMLLLPPHCQDRVEVFQHWEEIVLKETKEMVAQSGGAIRILNLPAIMLSTMVEFSSKEEYSERWLSEGAPEEEPNRLSAYGCRRLWDMLQRTAAVRPVPTAVSDYSCRRCLKNHPKSVCRSLDKVCRRCDLVGHFAYVHDVEDPDLRRSITQELGVDIFSPGPYEVASASLKRGGAHLKGPENALQKKLVKLSTEGGVGGKPPPPPPQQQQQQQGQVVFGPLPREEALFDDWYEA